MLGDPKFHGYRFYPPTGGATRINPDPQPMKTTAAMFLVAVLSTALSSCQFGCHFGTSENVEPPQAPIPRADYQKALSFSRDIAETINRGDASLLNQAMDAAALVRRATAGLADAATLQSQLEQQDIGVLQVGSQLVSSVSQGAKLKFLGLNWNGGRAKSSYLVDLPSGMNYIIFYLTEDSTGSIRIVDIFDYVSAEITSTRLRRLVAGRSSVGFSIRRMSEPTVGAAVDSMLKLAGAGSRQEAIKYSEQLPSAIRDDKFVAVQRILIGKSIGEDEYQAALRRMYKLFAGDPECDLIFIDLFFADRQVDSAQRAINRIDSAVGGDPYLNSLRAKAEMLSNNYDGARKYLRRYITQDSTSPEPWFGLTSIAVKQGKFSEVVRLMDTLRARFDFHFDPKRFANNPEYAGFLASPEFKAWEAGAKRK